MFNNDEETIDRARETLEAHPHALAKLDHLEGVELSRMAKRAAHKKAIGDVDAKIRHYRSEVASGESNLNSGGRRWTEDEIERRINQPRKRLAQAREQKKRLQKSGDMPSTLTVLEVAKAVKPNRQYRRAIAKLTEKQRKSPLPSLAKVREDIGPLNKERSSIKRYVIRSEEEYLALVNQEIEHLGAKGEPDFSSLGARRFTDTGREERPKIEWKSAFVGSGYDILDGAALVARYCPERIREDALAWYRRNVKPERVLSGDGRKQKLAELDRAIFALELQEEALIELCEAQGIEVLRRPDANPLAVLGIEPVGADAYHVDDGDNDEETVQADFNDDDEETEQADWLG
jgi:hypothetical protein